MAVTLKQVAETAGLSVATVNQVLNGWSDRFAPETAHRVEAAAASLGYKGNIAARGLRQDRSFLLGVLFYGGNYPLLPDFMKGLMSCLNDGDYSPVVFCSTDGHDEDSHLRRCLDRRVDGLIVNVADIADLNRWSVIGETPVIEVFGRFLSGVPTVNFDLKAAGARAVRHLISRGHRRIALLTHECYLAAKGRTCGPHFDAWEHFRGVEAELRSAGCVPIVVTHSLEEGNGMSRMFYEGGQRALDAIATHPGHPTAVICYQDYQALGLMQACASRGIAVPRELAIIGQGDVEMAGLCDPSLTTFRRPSIEVGREAATMLLRRIAGKVARNRSVEMEFVLRTSA